MSKYGSLHTILALDGPYNVTKNNSQIDEWKQIEISDMDRRIYGLIYDKRGVFLSVSNS